MRWHGRIAELYDFPSLGLSGPFGDLVPTAAYPLPLRPREARAAAIDLSWHDRT